MTYKQKTKNRSPTYFAEREIREIRKRNKGHLPLFSTIKEGQRVVGKIPRRTHQVGRFVHYKGKRYMVSKVSQKGVHLKEIKNKGKGYIDELQLGKEKFVPEKKYSGVALPVNTAIVLA